MSLVGCRNIDCLENISWVSSVKNLARLSNLIPRMKSLRVYSVCVHVDHTLGTSNSQYLLSPISSHERISPTLQLFLQPPPRSSVGFGGLHFQDHSKETDWLPPVEKSPTNCTLAFLCKFGSAWNSRVTRVSTSLAVEAATNVRPLTVVSIESGGPPEFAEDCAVCRIINVKFRVSSSSLLSLSMKTGAAEREDGSGSYLLLSQ